MRMLPHDRPKRNSRWNRFKHRLNMGAFWETTEIPLCILILVFAAHLLEHRSKMENLMLDAVLAGRPMESPQSVRLVTIDEQDYRQLFRSRSPLDPHVLSALCEAIAKAHPAAIVVDIDTSDSSFRGLRQPQVPTVWNAGATPRPGGKAPDTGADHFLSFAPPLGGDRLRAGATVALAFLDFNELGFASEYQHTYWASPDAGANDQGEKLIASPDYAVAQMFVRAPSPRPVAVEQNRRLFDFHYNFADPVPASDLIEEAEAPLWGSMAKFHNQVVVVGGTYHAARDEYSTPKGKLPGCVILAQAIEAELHGTSLARASRARFMYLMMAGALLIFLLRAFARARPARKPDTPRPGWWFGLARLTLKALVLLVKILVLVLLFSFAASWILYGRLSAGLELAPAVLAILMIEIYAILELLKGLIEVLRAFRGAFQKLAEKSEQAVPTSV